MKKIFYQIIGLCSLLGAATACNEDPEYFTLADQPDEMHIVASTDKLVLDRGKEDEIAITFSWDAAHSPVNATDLVSYSLRLYVTANKTANTTDFFELGSDLKKSFTHDELNSIVGTWVLPGQEVKVTAQVVATVHNEDKYIKPASSTVEFTVSGYEKYPAYIYICMTDADGKVSTQRLGQRSLGTGLYEGTFDVTPCTYHFVTVAGEDYPAYGNSGDDLHMIYLNEGEIKEFTNTETGRRTFIVDTNSEYNDCRMIEILELPVPETMYMVGNGCSVGWNLNSGDGLFKIEDARNPHLYSWTGEFNAGGEIKISLGGGSWGEDPFFFAPEPNADPLTNHDLDKYRLQGDGGDVKWVPTVSGRYKFTFCLDVKNMHTEFVPAN